MLKQYPAQNGKIIGENEKISPGITQEPDIMSWYICLCQVSSSIRSVQKKKKQNPAPFAVQTVAKH